MSQPSKKPEPASPPKQPVVLPAHNLELAAFTAVELNTLRKICRDADDENGTRALNAALARGGK